MGLRQGMLNRMGFRGRRERLCPVAFDGVPPVIQGTRMMVRGDKAAEFSASRVVPQEHRFCPGYSGTEVFFVIGLRKGIRIETLGEEGAP